MRLQKLLTNHFDITIKIIGTIFLIELILCLKYIDINSSKLFIIGGVVGLIVSSTVIGAFISIIYLNWLQPLGKYLEQKHPVTLISLFLLFGCGLLFFHFYKIDATFLPLTFICYSLWGALFVFSLIVIFYISRRNKEKLEIETDENIADIEICTFIKDLINTESDIQITPINPNNYNIEKLYIGLSNIKNIQIEGDLNSFKAFLSLQEPKTKLSYRGEMAALFRLLIVVFKLNSEKGSSNQYIVDFIQKYFTIKDNKIITTKFGEYKYECRKKEKIFIETKKQVNALLSDCEIDTKSI